MKEFSENLSSILKYNIYDNRRGEAIKIDCTFITVIPPGVYLSDDVVKKFFGTDETSPYWERQHKPHKYQRLVFDKCVIPVVDRYRIEVASV